jgi:hypothetical protein
MLPSGWLGGVRAAARPLVVSAFRLGRLSCLRPGRDDLSSGVPMDEDSDEGEEIAEGGDMEDGFGTRGW